MEPTHIPLPHDWTQLLTHIVLTHIVLTHDVQPGVAPGSFQMDSILQQQQQQQQVLNHQQHQPPQQQQSFMVPGSPLGPGLLPHQPMVPPDRPAGKMVVSAHHQAAHHYHLLVTVIHAIFCS